MRCDSLASQCCIWCCLLFSCAPAMSTLQASDILVELSDIADLLCKPMMAADTKDRLVISICDKIKSLATFKPACARLLCSSIEAMHCDDAYKQLIQTAIDERLAIGLVAVSGEPVKVNQRPQIITSVCNYLTPNDWTAISDPQAGPSKIMAVIASMWQRLGIRSLHEQTVKWSIVIVLHQMKLVTGQWPSYQTIFSWVTTFKREYAMRRTPWTWQVINKYPSDPSELPKDIFREAYDTGDFPIHMQIDNFSGLGAYIPLRSNSALPTGVSQSAAPSAGGRNPTAPLTWADLHAFMQRGRRNSL